MTEKTQDSPKTSSQGTSQIPESPQQAISMHPLLSRVLIVDDVYDKLDRDELSDRINPFIDAVQASENEEALKEEIGVHGGLNGDSIILSSQSLESLSQAILSPELTDLCDTYLFPEIREKRRQVGGIESSLTQRGITVLTAGSMSDLPIEAPDMVLLDYYLGFMSNEEARKQAVQKIQKIMGQYGPRVPFIVLMSSGPIPVEAQEAFRSEAKWIAGFFDFAPKSDLTSMDRLLKRLMLWELVFPNRRQILAFVYAIDESMKVLHEKFMELVRSLGLGDYAFLQRLHLLDDGEPLGEYMLWLFGSALPHLAFDENQGVKAARDQLDRVRFDTLLPANELPSKAAAQCYRLAISTPSVNAIAPHPLHPVDRENLGLPYLQTGDLLTGDTNTVWMVASPACDIAFAPGSDRDNPERYVVLIPGELHELTVQSKMPRDGEVVTRLFEWKDKPHRIFWRPKHPEYVKHGKFEEWRQERALDRTARLRLPYALEVQQAFAQNLVRIGMPVSPPIHFDAEVRLFQRGADGNGEQIGQMITAGARLLVLKDKRCFQLSTETISSILTTLPSICDGLRVQAGQHKDGPQKDSLLGKVERIENFLGDHKAWKDIIGKNFDLPSDRGGGRTIIEKVLSAYHNHKIIDDKYPDKSPLCINISPEFPERLPAAEEVPPEDSTQKGEGQV